MILFIGVEFRIMRIFDKNGNTIFGSEPGAEYELKPIYPLVQQLERAWPVKVNEREIPIMLTQSMSQLTAYFQESRCMQRMLGVRHQHSHCLTDRHHTRHSCTAAVAC